MAAPAARPAAGLLARSLVADGRSGAPAAGQLAGLAGRLELAGVWLREPPLTGPPADDLPALLEALGSESGPAAARLIVDARRLPARDISGIQNGPWFLDPARSLRPGAARRDRARPEKEASR